MVHMACEVLVRRDRVVSLFGYVLVVGWFDFCGGVVWM